MKIGILGSGNMGRSLGTLWAELGHEVFFGSREASLARGVAQAAGHGCQGGTLDEAATFGAVVLHTARDVLPSAMLSSTAALEGKTLIDCNNGVVPPGFAFETIAGESLTERIAADVPGANVVKAFNTMAQEVFELSPSPLKEHDVSCFVCGEGRRRAKHRDGARERDRLHPGRLRRHAQRAPARGSGRLHPPHDARHGPRPLRHGLGARSA